MKKFSVILIVLSLILLVGFAILTTTFKPLESLMRPPKVEGENLSVQLAFEEKVGTDYVLKQPVSGNYRSAFNFIDLTGDKKDEVVIFYSKADNLGIVRMNVLNYADGKWNSIADFQSVHNDIQEVEFADLNGNGNKEIIVGWTVFQDSYSKLINVYEVNEKKKAVRIYPVYGDYYSMFRVADFDANGRNDILTLKYAVAGDSAEYTGTILSYDNSKITERKTFLLDKSVNSVAAINFDYTDNGKTRIFVDGYKADSGMITDCFVWDTADDTLERMFVGGNSIASLTLRTSSVICKDINSDGYIEVPTENYLPNISDDNLPGNSNNLGTSLITWLWLHEDSSEIVVNHIIFSQYGFSFIFTDNMMGNISVENNTQKGNLTFYSLKFINGVAVKDKPVFSIMTLTGFDLDFESISETSFHDSLIAQVKDKYYYCRLYDEAEKYGITKKEIKNSIILG